MVKRLFVFNYVKEDVHLLRGNLRRLRMLTSEPVLIISDDGWQDEGLNNLVKLYKDVRLITNEERLKQRKFGFTWTVNYLKKGLEYIPDLDLLTRMDPDTMINSYPYLPEDLDFEKATLYSNFFPLRGLLIPHGAYINFTKGLINLLLNSPEEVNDPKYVEFAIYAIKGPYKGFSLSNQDVIMGDLISRLGINTYHTERSLCVNNPACKDLYPLYHQNHGAFKSRNP